MVKNLIVNGAIVDEGEVFSWGNNEYGQLAVESDVEQVCISEPSNNILFNFKRIKFFS